MANKTQELITKINDSQAKIAKLFIKQCKDGQQSKELISRGALACGQFLNVPNSAQRGIHGTASALLTINSHFAQDETHRDIIQNLTQYLAYREKIESQLQLKIPAERHECDFENVIKISEILIALSRLDSSINKGELCNQLVKKLIDKIISNQGWGFFLNDTEINWLPTAFAMTALYLLNRKDLSNAIKETLKSELKSKYKKDDYKFQTFIDYSIDIFCLYSLTFLGSHNHPFPDSELSKVFKKIWQQNKRFVSSGIEQNVEYLWKNVESCYVRIPVDLYMIALASYYDFKSAFSSSITQNRLKYIINEILDGGFYYPYAGKRVSARTNSILYEVLSIIKDNLANKKISNLQILKEKLDKYWNHWVTSLILFFLIVCITFIILNSYFKQKGDRLSGLGPEVLGIFLGLLISNVIGRLLRLIKRD